MAGGTLKFMMKVGLISEEMATPRTLTGAARLFLSVVGVGFSYFFIHISFFGPPVAEIFKGTFMMGVMVLSVLLFMGRSKPIRENFIWLDELFALFDIMLLCSLLSVWGYWQFANPVEQWTEFVGSDVLIMGGIGGLIGLAIYLYEALIKKPGNNPALSDYLYILSAVSVTVWWIISAQELTERMGGPVPAPVVFFSGMLVAVGSGMLVDVGSGAAGSEVS